MGRSAHSDLHAGCDNPPMPRSRPCGSRIPVALAALVGVLFAVLVFAPSAVPGPRPPPPPIVEGEPAGAGVYPAHGYLHVQFTPGRFRSCGGTLVGTRHFLTAAHCAVDG